MAKNKFIIDSEIMVERNFLELSSSAKALYFYLNSDADDMGIVSAWATMKKIGAHENDLKQLLDSYITILDSHQIIIFINHWNTHNSAQDIRWAKPSRFLYLLAEKLPNIEVFIKFVAGKKVNSKGKEVDDIRKLKMKSSEAIIFLQNFDSTHENLMGTQQLLTQKTKQENSNQLNTINNNTQTIFDLLEKHHLKIPAAVITTLININGIDDVLASIEYAIYYMPPKAYNPEGFVINSIQTKRKLSKSEREKMEESFEKQRKIELAKLEEAKKLAEQAERNIAVAKVKEAERLSTFAWWTMLSKQERQNYWELALVGLNDFAKKALGELFMPDDLVKLTTKDASIIVNNLTQIRKGQNNEQNRTTT